MYCQSLEQKHCPSLFPPKSGQMLPLCWKPLSFSGCSLLLLLLKLHTSVATSRNYSSFPKIGLTPLGSQALYSIDPATIVGKGLGASDGMRSSGCPCVPVSSLYQCLTRTEDGSRQKFPVTKVALKKHGDFGIFTCSQRLLRSSLSWGK